MGMGMGAGPGVETESWGTTLLATMLLVFTMLLALRQLHFSVGICAVVKFEHKRQKPKDALSEQATPLRT